jgi:predicted dehydrogenase
MTRTLNKIATRPKLGFLGVGWIGQNRMKAIAENGVADVEAIAEISPQNALAALATFGDQCAPLLVETLDDLLTLGLDGIVIATPSALHASQAQAAFEAGCAVFCQKPLGRSAGETRQVVEAAWRADRLLGVDLSYRYTAAARALYDLVHSGGLGRIFAVDLVFHNAYGPDKAWFYDQKLSGGGCVIDLGIHLVDLALWLLDFPTVAAVTSRLFSKGVPLRDREMCVEDYAAARIDLANGTAISLACSWNLPAGADAVIEVSLYGTNGGARLRNVDGSFYDFTAEKLQGTKRVTLTEPPDAWGGRAAVNWARRLASGERFDSSADEFTAVAEVLDAIYAGNELCAS